MRICASAVLILTLMAATGASAQVNMGDQKAEASLPFTMTKVASFDTQVWRMAFLPDGRFLAAEKGGRIWLMTQQGAKTPVANVPAVLYQGQGGLLGVFVSPHYAADQSVYLTYSEPHEEPGAPPIPPAPAVAPAGPPAGRGGGPRPTPCPADPSKVCGSSLAMARAKLTLEKDTARLDDLQVLWRDPAGGRGGQFGAQIAFAPDGRSLFLSVGDRQRMTPAQDPDSPLGKILRLTLDGKPAPGNPFAGQASAQSVPVIDPPRDTEAAKTAPVVRTFTYPASRPNMTRAETWTMGHRTPYGMAFAPNGQLWELEHGPGGGDRLNLIEPGKNYGWPLVGYGPNYNKVPVPAFDNQPGLTGAVIHWTPVIAPGMLTFYRGSMFPQWNGSALAGGMGSRSLTRIEFDGKGGATAVERWAMGFGVRDGQVAPDGALWISEGGLNNNLPGNIYRVTPK
jgi:glucose/arabinose dehydrogenase